MPPEAEHRPVDRRKFLRATTVAAAGAITLTAKSYAAVPGANERVRIGFLGCGGRAQAHIHLIQRLALETNSVAAVAVCDVWDGLEEEYEQSFGGKTTWRKYSQGLHPSAIKCGLDPADKKHVVKDYRRVLESKEVDAVCIATPDHWHARMTLDAAAAGKDVYCEKPMTRTPTEAFAVVDAMMKHNRVMTVGVQSLADPVWRAANEWLRTGRLGAIAHLSAGVFRNDIRGQWRFYRLVRSMTPRTVDWDLFLGHQFDVVGNKLGPTPTEQPFDRAVFAQWRCYSPFSGGPFTDLFVHQVSRLLVAGGLKFPNRVMGAGGLYHELDGRTVPDVGTLVADFDSSQMVITGSTASAYPQEEIIRGRLGAMKFVRGGFQVIADNPAGGSSLPTKEFVTVEAPANETEALWLNFLDCVKRRDRNTLSPSELGAAAATIVAMAQQSNREGRSLGWDAEQRVVDDVVLRSVNNNRANDLQPPEYMKLAGAWREEGV